MITKKQLLCTFSSLNNYNSDITSLLQIYPIQNNNIFIFENAKNKNEVFLTYNVLLDSSEFSKFPNTISIHRKKQTNTLYTLNAMNKLIRDDNNGVLDKTFQLNWELYKNSLIIITDSMIKIISINILNIIT